MEQIYASITFYSEQKLHYFFISERFRIFISAVATAICVSVQELGSFQWVPAVSLKTVNDYKEFINAVALPGP